MDKFKTCKDCPDRTVEPNCHMTCEGYQFRWEEAEKVRNERLKILNDNDYEFIRNERIKAYRERFRNG